MKIHREEVVTSRGERIPYTFVQKSTANSKICIMLPGIGYTTDQPVFYYSTGLFLEQEYDVLHLNYQYNNEEFNQLMTKEKIAKIEDDVANALDKVIPTNRYKHIRVVAKSIGTAALPKLLKYRTDLSGALTIWLTPLLYLEHIYEHLLTSNESRSLLIMGSEDRSYLEDRIKILDHNTSLIKVLIKNVNHDLDHKDGMVKSIKTLEKIIEEINTFSTSEYHKN